MLLVYTVVVFTCWFLNCIHCRSIHHGSSSLVHTRLGDIQGIRKKVDDTIVNAYLGVPFAKPPLKSKRFLLPEMVEPWKLWMATSPSPSCYSTPDSVFPNFPGAEMWNPPNKTTSEDCLRLNIWVPRIHDGNVMVWIYGGGFFSGSPSLDLYDGSTLAARKHVIVVNINYRLGPFGFLYFGPDTDVPGNVGLADQQLALRWIYENIDSFGGDNTKITLFGESAGAASVTSHLFAPDSFPYFQNIIIMSGTMINPWATKGTDMMLEISMRLATELDCIDDAKDPNMKTVIKCLQERENHMIQQAAENISAFYMLPMTFPFVPVSEDKHFLKGNLFTKFQKRDFKKDVNVFVGTMKDEGTYWLPYYVASKDTGFKFNHTISADDPANAAYTNQDQYENALKLFSPYFGNSLLVEQAFFNFYKQIINNKNDTEKRRDGVARFLGDFFFTCAVLEFADTLAENIDGSTYMYYFTKRSSANSWPKWMGAMHGYEIEYVFGQPFRRSTEYAPSLQDEEMKFSDKVMDYWTNFAKKSKPDDDWPMYNTISREAVILADSSSGRRVAKDVHGLSCRILDEAEETLTNGQFLVHLSLTVSRKFT
uniref:Carboxylic ester hydrolase n=1 Tax=Syphacia muris TaxID=451379 RepID=A0A0N5ABF7_9BILA